MRSRAVLSLVLLVGAACSPPLTTRSAPVATSVVADSLPNDVIWVRSSAEYRALARQAYAVAGERLPEFARGLPAQSWAVILDADETVLDNSEYQRRLAVAHAAFDSKGWTAWVNERAALAVPGALEFTRLVHSMGGRVAIVTNRSLVECDATRENLHALGLEADIVLCQPPGEGNADSTALGQFGKRYFILPNPMYGSWEHVH